MALPQLIFLLPNLVLIDCNKYDLLKLADFIILTAKIIVT